MTRTCPVYRTDVVYEASCIACVCFDQKTTGCKVIQGKIKAKNDDGVIVIVKEE